MFDLKELVRCALITIFERELSISIWEAIVEFSDPVRWHCPVLCRITNDGEEIHCLVVVHPPNDGPDAVVVVDMQKQGQIPSAQYSARINALF